MSAKYLKVMFDDISGANDNLKYKLDEVNIAKNFNPNANNPKEMGGFNFSTEDKIFRWLVRGDTLYDVIIQRMQRLLMFQVTLLLMVYLGLIK